MCSPPLVTKLETTLNGTRAHGCNGMRGAMAQGYKGTRTPGYKGCEGTRRAGAQGVQGVQGCEWMKGGARGVTTGVRDVRATRFTL